MALTSLFITLYEEQNIIINCKKLYHIKKAGIREQNIFFFFLNKFKKETILTQTKISSI